MLTESDSVNADRLNSIECRLEEMVERKWSPLREKHECEPMEVRRVEDGVLVGHVNKLWVSLLRDDVIRTFDTGYYDIVPRPTDRGRAVVVRPISQSEYYDTPDGADVQKAAVIEALTETGIHVPKVLDTSGAAWLKHFETKVEAEEAAKVLEPHIEAAYDEMWNGNVEELEVREFEEPRERLAPDSWYAIIVHYE